MSLPKNTDPYKTNLQSADYRESDTCTCALLTGPGRSAIAVIGVRGTAASELVSRCFLAARPSPLSPGQVRYGQWRGRRHNSGSDDPSLTAESVVVVPFAADDLEIQCHGGVAASKRILDDLRDLGAECLPSAQWSRRSDAPLLIREAEHAVTGCLTARMAAVAMDQVRGATLDWCRDALATARREPGLAMDDIREQTQTILQSADLGLRLGHRYQVVLLGPPNVGKSSLVNAIVGYDRSITMDQAGTTRDVLHADTVVGGVPIRLSDTAGLRESDQPIEREGVARARTAADDADLVVVVSDPNTPAMAVPKEKKALWVFNKSDLETAAGNPDDSVIRTVAISGQGVDKLMDAIVTSLVQFAAPGSPVPVTERQVDLLRRLSEASLVADAEFLLRQLIDG